MGAIIERGSQPCSREPLRNAGTTPIALLNSFGTFEQMSFPGEGRGPVGVQR